LLSRFRLQLAGINTLCVHERIYHIGSAYCDRVNI
jgi:hypothetical protein